MPRMKILNAVEQEAFNTPPVFNSAQRKRYFDFSMETRRQAVKLRTPTNRLCFLLNCGYFKASKRFFPTGLSHRPDIEYVARHASIDLTMVDMDSYDKQSLLRHQQTILQLHGFGPFDKHAQTAILHEIEAMARSQLKPRLIFWRCVDLLISRKIQIPTYFRLSELILNAINNRKKELAAIIENNLSERLKASLEEFFVQGSALGNEPVSSKTAAYKLTLLKKLSQSTKPSKIKERVGDLSLIRTMLFLSLPPFGMDKSMQRKIVRNNSGFTLLEVILVIVFISIFAAIAASRQPVPEVTIRSASHGLVSHIRYAQMRAMNSAVPWGIGYTDANGTYWLFEDTPADRQPFPGATDDHIDLSAEGISITQGDFTLSFDDWGVPTISDAGFTFAGGRATLTLSTGTRSGDVTIAENTGYTR